jgi:D-glycero-D-manno-heptose 1,7-bisphosphate phosphatase
MDKALFLDRDGVINVDTGYPAKPSDIIFIDGIFDFCRQATAQGYRLIVITNQAGIARGYYSAADFQALMEWMQARFTAESCPLTAWYFCPHHPEFGEIRDCSCRKPKPGMITQAVRDWNIDLGRSVLIGDKPSDIEAGRAACVAAPLLFNGYFDSKWLN